MSRHYSQNVLGVAIVSRQRANNPFATMSAVAAAPSACVLTEEAPVEGEDKFLLEDPLLTFLPSSGPLSHVREALLTEGFCVLPSVLTEEECNDAIASMWDFVEDTSSGSISRDHPETWYPRDSSDNWPHTNYKSFSDMFQSIGAGWVLGAAREALAERVFEPLYQTRELHSSKEGFTFHRPTALKDHTPPSSWVERVLNPSHMVCGEQQDVSKGEHYDQPNQCRGLHTIQSLVAFEDQEEDVDGHFLCYPRSHGHVHQELTKDIYRGKFAWIPLTDDEIQRLTEEMQLECRRVYLKRGDVILWRSDLVHAAVPPTGMTRRFRAVGYTSMQPASLTPSSVYTDKINAYKQRQTGDHRPHVESWHSHRSDNPNHRPAFRTSPPLVTRRLAELYGLLPYGDASKDFEAVRNRALIRGVRFAPESLPTQPTVRSCQARLEFISAPADDNMVGSEKYMGGMVSACGKYIYGVPGGAKRVLRINTESNSMDWIGPSFEGKFKWLRGVEIPASVMDCADYPRGCCLALPSNATAILKINPETNEVTTFGKDTVEKAGKEGWYYHGGNLASNGMVYAIPANADRVLKIDPVTNECWFIGPSFPGRQSWFGGIIGSDDCIYGIPHNQVGVLKIDPSNDEVSVLMQENGEPLPSGEWKWHGGLAAGHKIFGYPNNADTVLVINVKEQRVYTVGDASMLKSGRHRIPQDGRYKYLGGALSLDEKYTYLFPCDAERVLKIHNETDELELIGPLLLDGENKYQNGFVSEIDGCLYGIPQRATGILRIDPTDDHVDVMSCGEKMIDTKDKFEGGVMGLDGAMYCIPLRTKTCVKIIPASKESTCSSS